MFPVNDVARDGHESVPLSTLTYPHQLRISVTYNFHYEISFFTLCKYLTLEVVHLIATLTMYSELTQNMYDLRIDETDQLTIKRNENMSY